ncbi:MAG: cytochrome c family protein [Acidobacteriota bacterium]|nr:cytochrome c family protein [Acidobacteriota bacterium]
MKRETLWIVVLAVVAALFAGTAARAQEGQFEYVGSKSCKKCHLKEFKSWEATKMAQTFETLKPGAAAEAKTGAGLDPEKDYTTDEACVKCHVTGYGQPGGFVDIETTPELVGVGCEMCHGPGGTYIQDGYMTLENKEYKKADLVAVGLVDKVGEAQCVNCHNSESPFVDEGFVFDFEAQKSEGLHENFELKYSH